MSDSRDVKFPAEDISWTHFAGKVFVDSRLTASEDELGRIYYRYASLPETIQLIADQTMSFSDPRVWPDKYERYGMASLFDPGGRFEDVSVFAKCFSGSYSSEAMWRIYGADEPLARYGYSLIDLLNQLGSSSRSGIQKIYVAKVQYVSPGEVRRVLREMSSSKAVASNAAKALFYKRKAFDHESELRVVIVRKRGGEQPRTIKLKGFSRERVTRILIDPYVAEWQAKVLVSLFKNELSFTGRIKRSTFDNDLPLAR